MLLLVTRVLIRSFAPKRRLCSRNMSASDSSTVGQAVTSATSVPPTPLVMQIVVDGAAASPLGWSKGIWMAQAAHASIAVIQSSAKSVTTQEYVSATNLESMHKVVLQTAASGKSRMDLRQLSTRMTEARLEYERHGDDSREEEFPLHWLWIEQPENTPTCLAIAPNRKPAELKKILRSCTLFKD